MCVWEEGGGVSRYRRHIFVTASPSWVGLSMSSRWTQLAKGARISDHLKALRTDFVVSLDSHIDWFTEYSHYDLTKESMRRLQHISNSIGPIASNNIDWFSLSDMHALLSGSQSSAVMIWQRRTCAEYSTFTYLIRLALSHQAYDITIFRIKRGILPLCGRGVMGWDEGWVWEEVGRYLTL